jgi:hypothetical protein
MTDLITYEVLTDVGERYWAAEDENHALEMHKDAFGDSEQIISVEAMSNPDGTPTEAGWRQIVRNQAEDGYSETEIAVDLGIPIPFIREALDRR